MIRRDVLHDVAFNIRFSMELCLRIFYTFFKIIHNFHVVQIIS